MPRGEKQNFKYSYNTSWLPIAPKTSNCFDNKLHFRIYTPDLGYDYSNVLNCRKVDDEGRIDYSTVETQSIYIDSDDYYHYGEKREHTYSMTLKKKIYPSSSGLKYSYTITYPKGTHPLWSNHYLEAGCLVKEMKYIVKDLKGEFNKLNYIKYNESNREHAKSLRCKYSEKQDQLKKDRDEELTYELIIAGEIPVLHRVFLSPRSFTPGKYGIGPINKWERLSYTEGRLYSYNPVSSIEQIRNDKDRNENLNQLCDQIHNAQGKLNQIEKIIERTRRDEKIIDYENFDLSYFDENEITELLNEKSRYDAAQKEIERLTKLYNQKAEKLLSIRTQDCLDGLVKEVHRVSERSKNIERLQCKKQRIKQRWAREEAERKRQEEARIAEEKRQARIAKKRADHKAWLSEKLPSLQADLINHTCGCTSRKGTVKKWYATKSEAFTAAGDRMSRNSELDLEVYECPATFQGPYGHIDCGGYHLTSTKDY